MNMNMNHYAYIYIKQMTEHCWGNKQLIIRPQDTDSSHDIEELLGNSHVNTP